MKHPILSSLLLLLAALPPAAAQSWELGGAVGGSFNTSNSISSPAGSATAGIATGVAGSVWLGNNSSSHLGGEFRYDYSTGDLKLSSGGSSTQFAGRAQAFHYDLLYHFAPRASRVRPFLAAGGGFKYYSGTGQEQAYQPLEQYALLTKTNQLAGLISVGGGIKFNVSPHLQMRIEVHDYLSPFPNQVIAPAAGAHISGWLQQIVPSFGISYVF